MLFSDNTIYDVAADNINQGAIEKSAMVGMLEHMPSLAATTGWNASRIGNTIVKGGYNERRRSLQMRQTDGIGKSYGKFRNNNPISPKNWTRVSSSAQVHGAPILDESGRPTGKSRYTPANFMSNALNKSLAKHSTALAGHARTGSYMARAEAQGINFADDAFQSGALGKFNAMGRMGMKKNLSARGNQNIMNYLKGNDQNLFNFMNKMPETSPLHFGAGGKDQVRRANQLISMSGDHTATNFMGGFRNAVHGGGGADIAEAFVKNADRGALRAKDAMNAFNTAGDAHKAGVEKSIMEGFEKSAAGKKTWIKGGEKATEWLSHGNKMGPLRMGERHFAEEFAEKGGLRLLKSGIGEAMLKKGGSKLALKVGAAGAARYATGAIPVVGQALMAVQLAYDVTNMAMEGVKGVGKFTGDAVTSMKGSIDKPAMGMGFRDNEVAATSRARGVAAIQNSRLNARSVLGSEGAYLHARYG